MASKKTYGTFTRVVDGETIRRTAYSPADAVQARYDGWTEEAPVEPAKAAPAKATSPAKAAKAAPAGKQSADSKTSST